MKGSWVIVSRFNSSYTHFSLTYISLAPIIAVFTKFDELVTREDRKLNAPEYDDLSEEELEKLAHSNANKSFESECLRVFQTTVGTQIPYKPVSSQSISSDRPQSICSDDN